MFEGIPLGRCAVVMGDECAYVRLGVEDLRAYLQELTGERPLLHGSAKEVGRAETIILVGKLALDEAGGNPRPVPEAGLPADPQSYVLSVRPGKPATVTAAGSDPQGTKYALIDLVRAIRTNGRDAWLPADLSIADRPYFGLRGMYAHLHWQYNHPYALRSWSLEDWKRYVDLLAYMKLNLLQIWTMAAICPNPLSPRDEAYLTKYHEVVRYAREMRGMEVWPGECANNLAESDFGEPIERREYFQVEVLKNPADPGQFQDIMDNRANMYRLVNNGDGYWIIDSDPGKWQGSPAGELADIFGGNRALIDRYADRAEEAKLIYWMHQGWGTGSPEENWRAAIEGIRNKVHEPWWLTPCNGNHLKLVSEMGYVGKSVFFPYGAIEPEPSNPLTHVKFDVLSNAINLALKHAGLAGIMGNAQTPFAQLPNIFYFAECAWNPECAKLSDHEILTRLGRFLFPAIETELAEAWLASSRPGSGPAFEAGRTLEALLQEGKTGAPGAGGRFIFPDPKLVVKDLTLLLKMHGCAERVRESVEAGRGDDAIQGAVCDYLSSVLEWQKRTGWHGCRVNGVDFSGGGTLLHGGDFVTVGQSLRSYFENPGKQAERDSWTGLAEARLKKAGFEGSMSERAVFEVIVEPGQRRADGRL